MGYTDEEGNSVRRGINTKEDLFDRTSFKKIDLEGLSREEIFDKLKENNGKSVCVEDKIYVEDKNKENLITGNLMATAHTELCWVKNSAERIELEYDNILNIYEMVKKE